MEEDKLIHMANQIGQFFAAMPDHDEAVDGVATHIRKFWEPRMRRKIFEASDAKRAQGLSPIAADALERHRATLQPAS